MMATPIAGEVDAREQIEQSGPRAIFLGDLRKGFCAAGRAAVRERLVLGDGPHP